MYKATTEIHLDIHKCHNQIKQFFNAEVESIIPNRAYQIENTTDDDDLI